MPKFRTTPWKWLLISMLITGTVAVPVSLLVMPAIARWQTLRGLDSADDQVRQRALSYVVQHAGTDPATRERAIEALRTVDHDAALLIHAALVKAGQASDPTFVDAMNSRLKAADDAQFLQLYNAMDIAGQWQYPDVDRGPYLRWLAVLAAEKDPNARQLAIDRLGQFIDAADDARVLNLLQTLHADDDPAVRLQVLITAVDLQQHADDRLPYHRLITAAATDTDANVAYRAFIYIGLINPLSGIRPNFADLPPKPAAAALWAALRTNPQRPLAAIDALSNPGASPHLQRMAPIALHQSATDDAAAALTAVLRSYQPGADAPPDHLLTVWRAALAAPPGASVHLLPEDRADVSANAAWAPIAFAAAHRNAAATLDDDDLTDPATVEAWVSRAPIALLAALEGATPGSIDITLCDAMPDMLRLAAVRADATPDVDDLVPLLEHPRAAFRDLACVVAVQRFDDTVLDKVIVQLIKSFNDDAKQSGAILAGMTGLQPQLLAKRAAAEDQWLVKQVMLMGMWMQDQPLPDGADGDQLARGLLSRDDLPTTTILLAMLHRGDDAALDYLLKPRGEPIIDLNDLLDQLRWWHVLDAYLPADAPPLWVWADGPPQTQPDPARLYLTDFQIDVLRSWRHLNPDAPLRRPTRPH